MFDAVAVTLTVDPSVSVLCVAPATSAMERMLPISVTAEAVAAPVVSSNFISAFVVIVPKPGKHAASSVGPEDV